RFLGGVTDFAVWYAKSIDHLKYRDIFIQRESEGKGGGYNYFAKPDGTWSIASNEQLKLGADNEGGRLLQLITLTSQRQGRETGQGSAMGFPVMFAGSTYLPSANRGWTTTA